MTRGVFFYKLWSARISFALICSLHVLAIAIFVVLFDVEFDVEKPKVLS